MLKRLVRELHGKLRSNRRERRRAHLLHAGGGVDAAELVAAALREGLDITIERQKEAKRLALILYEIL